MTQRRKQILEWFVKNFDKWPAPLDTNPDGPDPEEIGCEWVNDQNVSCQPILRDRLGGTYNVTATDWFYNRQKVKRELEASK